MEYKDNNHPVQMNDRSLKTTDQYNDLLTYQPEYHEQYDDDLDIKNILDIFIRKKWLILFFVTLAAIYSVFSALKAVPLYKAAATIEIKPVLPKITSFDDPAYSSYSDYRYGFQTEFKLIRSKSLARLVLSDIKKEKGLNNSEKSNKPNKNTVNINFFSKIKDRIFKKESLKNSHSNINHAVSAYTDDLLTDSEVDGFISNIIVSPIKQTRLASISYVSSDPVYSAQIANRIVDKYIEWNLNRKVETSKSAKDFLENQIGQVKAKIEIAEEKLSEYASGMDIISLDKDVELNYQQLTEVTNALTVIETERLKKEALYKEVQAGNFNYLPEVTKDEYIMNLTIQYSNIKSQYNEMSTIYGPNYPEIKRIKSQLGSIKNEMKTRLNIISETIKKDFEATKREEGLLKNKAEEKKRKSLALNEQAIQYRILEREVESNKSIFKELLQRLKEKEVTSAFKDSNIQVVDYATIPLFAFSPNTKRDVVVTTMLGLLLGFICAYTLEFFNTKLVDEEEVKKKFPDVPYLGSIPLINDINLDLEKISSTNPKSLMSESFRVLRTSIMYSAAEHSPSSILVTSSQPIEGKTTTSSNLALSINQSGLNTILIDADLRKPRLHRFYSKNGDGHGLSNYLVGELNMEDVIQKTDFDNMDFISSGPIPPNPAELLGSNKMQKMIYKLQQKYQHIILDGPPIHGFADSLILSRIVDGVLLITSVGITQKANLRDAINDIRRVRGKILGMVVNRVDSSSSNYKYKYYYYYNDHARLENKSKKRISSPNS